MGEQPGLYLPVAKHQDCDLRPYQGDCADGPNCRLLLDLLVVGVGSTAYGTKVDDTAVYDKVDTDGGDGDSNSSESGKDSPNTNYNKEHSSHSMDSPSHSTNYMPVLPQHPTSRTSRLYT